MRRPSSQDWLRHKPCFYRPRQMIMTRSKASSKFQHRTRLYLLLNEKNIWYCTCSSSSPELKMIQYLTWFSSFLMSNAFNNINIHNCWKFPKMKILPRIIINNLRQMLVTWVYQCCNLDWYLYFFFHMCQMLTLDMVSCSIKSVLAGNIDRPENDHPTCWSQTLWCTCVIFPTHIQQDLGFDTWNKCTDQQKGQTELWLYLHFCCTIH